MQWLDARFVLPRFPLGSTVSMEFDRPVVFCLIRKGIILISDHCFLFCLAGWLVVCFLPPTYLQNINRFDLHKRGALELGVFLRAVVQGHEVCGCVCLCVCLCVCVFVCV